MLQILQVRQGHIDLFVYPLQTTLVRELAQLNALERAHTHPIFQRFLSPRKFKPRYNLDRLDQTQGRME
jgi:hypothetical protein